MLRRLLTKLGIIKKATGPDVVYSTKMSPEQIKQLVINIANTQDVELDCGDSYALLDEYAELVARGEEAGKLMPLVEHHLEMCPGCNKQYEALARILRALPPQGVNHG